MSGFLLCQYTKYNAILWKIHFTTLLFSAILQVLGYFFNNFRFREKNQPNRQIDVKQGCSPLQKLESQNATRRHKVFFFSLSIISITWTSVVFTWLEREIGIFIIFKVHSSRCMNRLVMALNVYCTKKEFGCEWTGTIENYLQVDCIRFY